MKRCFCHWSRWVHFSYRWIPPPALIPFLSLCVFICHHPFAVGKSDHPLLVKHRMKEATFVARGSRAKRGSYIYRNWWVESKAALHFCEGGLWVISAFTFRNWRGQTNFPWESSKKNDSILSLQYTKPSIFPNILNFRIAKSRKDPNLRT